MFWNCHLQHQTPASLAFVRGIHRGPGKSPHKWPVTRKQFPFDDVIIQILIHGRMFFVLKRVWGREITKRYSSHTVRFCFLASMGELYGAMNIFVVKIIIWNISTTASACSFNDIEYGMKVNELVIFAVVSMVIVLLPFSVCLSLLSRSCWYCIISLELLLPQIITILSTPSRRHSHYCSEVLRMITAT